MKTKLNNIIGFNEKHNLNFEFIIKKNNKSKCKVCPTSADHWLEKEIKLKISSKIYKRKSSIIVKHMTNWLNLRCSILCYLRFTKNIIFWYFNFFSSLASIDWWHSGNVTLSREQKRKECAKRKNNLNWLQIKKINKFEKKAP